MKFTMTEIMILLAFIAMLTAIAIPPVRRRIFHRPIAASIILVMMALLVVLAVPAQAQPQIGIYQPTTLVAATNLPAVVTAAASSNTTSIIDVPQKLGLGFTWQFNLSAGTSNACTLIYPSQDGTNFDTSPWALLRSANGTTDVIATTNWTHNQLVSYRKLKIGAQTNQNNGTLSNKLNQWSFENP